MRRLAILAVVLPLTVACGDNAYVPVEVDDESTADFARATVDVDRRAMADDYVAPTTAFSYARTRVADRVEWADEIGAIAAGAIAWSDIYPAGEADPAAIASCSDFGLDTAPSVRERSDAPVRQAPEHVTATRRAGEPNTTDASTGEAIAEELSCGAPIDENEVDDMVADVCECTDVSCVADFVYDTMGCNACMSFMCGDELLGACATCVP